MRPDIRVYALVRIERRARQRHQHRIRRVKAPLLVESKMTEKVPTGSERLRPVTMRPDILVLSAHKARSR